MSIDLNKYLDSSISDTQAALRTYSTYTTAWCIWTQRESLRAAQSQLPSFSRLRPSKESNVETVKRHLLRGWLTLALVRRVAAEEEPDFALTSALWLPVQTYYAVHGFGMACLAARRSPDQLPRTHGAFMRVAGNDLVRRLFPSPLSALLQDGYKGNKYLQPDLVNLDDDRRFIGPGTNLERPNGLTRDTHIAQCLDTTRRRLINEKLDEARKKARKPGKRHGVLRRPTQIAIAESVAPTTVLDYLYRTRLKSNYEDPTMYSLDQEDRDAVLELVAKTQELAAKLCALMAAILWRTTKKGDRDRIFERLDLDDLFSCIEG